MGGFFEKLNKPKSLLVVLVLTLIVDSLFLYRYQSMMSPDIFEIPVLEESSAAPTEEATAFAATVGQDWQEVHSGAKNTSSEAQRPENKSPVVSLGSAREPTTLAPAPSHTLYLPVLLYRPDSTTGVAPGLPPGSPPWATSQSTPLVVSPAASPTTERFASASSPVPREEASEAATPEAVTPTAPASKPATTTDRESAPKEPVEAPEEPEEAYPMATAPAPKDLVSAPLGQDAIVPRGGVPDDTIPTTAPQKSTKDGSTPLQSPPTEQPLPPPIPSAQAQCRDGGFVALGFENQDDCLSFLATQGKKEPSKQDQKK